MPARVDSEAEVHSPTEEGEESEERGEGAGAGEDKPTPVAKKPAKGKTGCSALTYRSLCL